MSNPIIFELRLDIKGECLQLIEIEYASIIECLRDDGLMAMLMDGLVTDGAIWCGHNRITARPITDWGTLRDQLIANASSILRLAFPK